MIENPILPGFNPDPCICRRGEDYYLAVSTFEWLPGIPVFHSRDLKHWELITHILSDEQVDLKKLPSAKGLWAPCLTYCEEEGLFCLVYGVMNSMNARYFDVDNFLITASDICGPWSEPVYLHSAGFDASMLHDGDGKKYIVSLQWETRDNYNKPGPICLAEYDPEKRAVVGYPKPIWYGATDRGCLEAPHLTKRGEYYYLMCAEGGTGYNHCVTMARSKSVYGPYESDPRGPLLTSNPGEFSERGDIDHLKPRHYNPRAPLQKAGHGSYVDLPNGETYLVYHCARPFVPELRCTLGRETAIQKMEWTDDGWLRMAGGGCLARAATEEPALPPAPVQEPVSFDGFDGKELEKFYYAPRVMPESFADLQVRPGWVRLKGQESLSSLNKVSLLARKLTAVNSRITVKMDFNPEIPQHTAGLTLYYDNMDYFSLEKYYSETLGGQALLVTVMENGKRSQCLEERTLVKPGAPLFLRLHVDGRESWFEWSYDGEAFAKIGPVHDTGKLSDEYCTYGEFTGTMAGIFCVDRMYRRHYADFDFFCCDRFKPSGGPCDRRLSAVFSPVGNRSAWS